ncbi:MAG: ATP-binding cassette domain-containing protein [Caldilineaceae bacterium]
MKQDKALVTHELKRSFRVGDKTIEAVKGVDLTVNAGEVCALLGPNGAGKTTTLRMLTTLLAPSSGEAMVAGCDVMRQPGEVRKRIGFVGQFGGTDLGVSGVENLVLQGRLYGLSHGAARARAEELAEALHLSEFFARRADTLSGGQRRQLDIALGLVNRPAILFLDEPTIGLDPQNRAQLWELLRELKASGVTIILTTHYLEEADNLASQIVIVDQGKIVAQGTPAELKRQVAGDAVTISARSPSASLCDLQALFAGCEFVNESRIEGDSLRLYVEDGAAALPEILATLGEGRFELAHISLSQPSLDDVFLQKTGRSLRDKVRVEEEEK